MFDSGVARFQSQLTLLSLLANEFDVTRSVLPGQVSLASANQIYVLHEAMNSCKI